MITRPRRSALREHADAHAFDAGWRPEIGVPFGALVTLLIQAKSAEEREYLFGRFWRRFVHHRARRLGAETRDVLREATV